jgi:prephenate dehydratase
MTKNVIAFQGIAGANSDLACRKAYPYMDTKAYESFEQVFQAVENGEAELGMIPIENSQAGRVAEIHNLLPKSNVYIVAEHFQKIRHDLLAPKGATLQTIRQVYSHPQGLMQCRKFLLDNNLEGVAHSNTAAAAKSVGEWADPSKAAIASPLAGELYGLVPLKENIQDTDSNFSVFIVICKDPHDPKRDKKILTTLLFSVRNIPASLYKAMGGFATNGVNMVKLESYIPAGSSDTAQFFVTVEGNPEDRNVQLAIEELGFFCKKVRVLGVYNADESR